MSISLDEEEIELDKITQICARKLEDEIVAVMQKMDGLHSFLALWENAIGKDIIEKIEIKEIK